MFVFFLNNSSISSSDDLPICRDQIQNQADGDIHLELWRRQVEMLNLVAQATLNSIIKRSQDPKRCNMAGKCSIRGGFNWKIICIYIYMYVCIESIQNLGFWIAMLDYQRANPINHPQ